MQMHPPVGGTCAVPRSALVKHYGALLGMFIDYFYVLSTLNVDDRYLLMLLCEFHVQISAVSVFMCKNSAGVIIF